MSADDNKKMNKPDNKPKKRGRPRKNPQPEPSEENTLEEEDDTSRVIAQLLENSILKYQEVTDKELQGSREDFDSLQPIISEFLDEFIIIGHTLEGNRVVMRYAESPAQLDSLTELCKKVLVKMMIQEQSGG